MRKVRFRYHDHILEDMEELVDEIYKLPIEQQILKVRELARHDPGILRDKHLTLWLQTRAPQIMEMWADKRL